MYAQHSAVPLRAYALAWLAVAAAFVLLDLLFLGVLAADFFNEALGSLRARKIVVAAAALFYVMYVSAITAFAVAGSRSLRGAAVRGAAMGGFAYATYELTNWAVIEGWPAQLVPLDIAWGVFVTAVCAWCGKRVWLWSHPGD